MRLLIMRLLIMRFLLIRFLNIRYIRYMRYMHYMRLLKLLPTLLMCCGLLFLFGCSKPTISTQQDSAPKHIPKHLDKVQDPIPKVEPLSRYGNRFKNSNSYVALKRKYTVMPTSRGYRAQGKASWYGTKFQGRRTSSGEPYDMFAMTAAHKTLPLPTYARVTNVDNGKSVIVKINDRGPFHHNRIIDLSYVAAHKLGILGKGTGNVMVESVDPRDHHGRVPGQKRGFFARNNVQKNDHINNGNHTTTSVATTMASKTATKPATIAMAQQTAVAHKAVAPTAGTQQKLYLQIGAFSQKSHAETLVNEVSKLSKYSAAIATQKQNKKSLFKVRLGPFDNQKQLQQATKALAQANLPTPVMVKD